MIDTAVVLAAALVTAALCVLIHWLFMELLVRRLCLADMTLSRSLLTGMSVLVLAHLIEITLYAVGIWLLCAWEGENAGRLVEDGQIVGPTPFATAWYFSSACFTTAGFGDVVAVGPMRYFAGIEAVVGFLMITWSASFGFYIMNHAWRQQLDG